MDSQEWSKLKELVDENGHGCIQFEYGDEILVVEEIEFLEQENAIVVTLGL